MTRTVLVCGGRDYADAGRVAEVFPVGPDTCTVLGYRQPATSPMWRGLDLSQATARTQATIWWAFFGKDAPFDLHLRVPYAHPDDGPEGWEGTFYRVRPQAEPGRRWRGRTVESVTFEREGDGPWMVAVTWKHKRRARAAGVLVMEVG